MNEQFPLKLYRKFSVLILFTIIAVVMAIYVTSSFILKSFGIEGIQIDSFLSTMISVSTGVYISIIVYIYAKKQENSRKLFLTKQIIDYFDLLKQGYGNDISSRQRNPDGSASELKINESFFNQKNTVALHIFDSVNELGDKISPLLLDFIKNVSIHALGFPEIKKNIHGEYLEPNYSQYRVFLHGMDVALDFLKENRTDFNTLPEETKKILELQGEAQENQM